MTSSPSTTSLPPAPAPGPNHFTRIHFWNTAGCQSLVVPTREACGTRDRLLASDCVIYHSEFCSPK